MKNKGIILTIIAVFCIATAVFYFLPKFETAKKYNWFESYNHDKKQPYDFVLLQELLKKSYDFERLDNNPSEKLDIDNAEGKGYLFIGNYPYHAEESAEKIVEFAQNGGEVVLITNSKPDFIFSQVNTLLATTNDINTNHLLAKQIEVIFSAKDKRSKSFDFSYKKGSKDTVKFDWPYIDNNSSSRFQSYSSFTDKQSPNTEYSNFIGVKIGNGMIYWHCNPLLFSNLYLSKNNISGFEHLDAFFSHFKAQKWYWDHASVYPAREPMSKENDDKPLKTSMQYVFSQPALKLAWTILIITTILYGLFGAKRRQQQIPIVEANRNNSLEFVNTIGLLYYQQQDHKVIFEKMMQLFRSHLRQKYGLIIKDEEMLDEDKIKHIVKRTDISESIIRDILENYMKIKSKFSNTDAVLSSETLNRFYLLIDNFYKAEINRKLSPQKTI